MAELTQLITTLQEFIEKIKVIPESKRSAKDVLATQNLSFDQFDESSESFDCYSQRLENYFKLKGLSADDAETEELKVLVLINCLGSRQYQLLSSLTAPDVPSTKTFKELLLLLKQHLSPKPNVLTEQHKFFSRLQNQGESISTFISSLKDLTKNAEFISECNSSDCSKSMLNLLLRSQFIRGLSDSDIREKLLQQGDLTFEKTIEIALAIEAAKIENKEIYKSNFSTSINKISNNNIKNKRHFQTRDGNSQNRSKTKSPIKSKAANLKELGLEGLCLHCGKSNHKTQNCFLVKKLRCKSCEKQGHLASVCISSLIKNKTDNRKVNYIMHDSDDFAVNQIYDVFFNDYATDDKMYATVKLNGVEHRFECDSGSKVSIMNVDEFKKLKLNVQIRKTNISFRSYTGQIFKPLGVVKLNASYQNNLSYEDLYVVSNQKNSILGRDWIRKLNINLHDLNKISNFPYVDTSVSKIIDLYSDVFKPKIGCIPDFTCSLKLKANAKPVFIKARTVPYALKQKVEKELDKLEAEGIIEKTDFSEWGTPLVVISKHDGSVRICADFKVTVNKQLQSARHPIPRIEDIFNKLRDGKFFCTLDIHKAYLHMKVDEESAKVQTLSTHRGTYLAKRLFFGIKTAPNEFHKFMDQFVQDLDGTIAYFDDIIIQGKSKQECQQRLFKVLKKLREFNLHVNLAKCKFFEEKVQYLGHIISSAGLHKSPEKIKAISETPRPKNVDDVRKFIGLVMYYSKFIPDASSLLHPLNNLLCKNIRFKWTAQCEAAFLNSKSVITSNQVLVPYNPDLPVTLATDASPFGLSGVLSHTMPDGTEHPIAFASRSLTAAEKNYSQLDREATAVVWACKKFYDYIFGRKFTLIMDNKAICTIFHPEKTLPVMSASRMLRYAHFLSSFDYTIVHRKSDEHLNADYLSRYPLPISTNQINCIDEAQAHQQFIINYISTETITAEKIKEETGRDPELRKIKYDIVIGNIFDPTMTLQDGILFRGNRVIVPKSLQPEMLKQLHSTHVGIVKMKALSRNYCYWKNIDSDIENTVKSCRECCNIKKNPAKAPLHIWEPPEKNWQRVHIDYAGPFMERHFLIVVDALSKWPEIFAINKSPTSSSTISLLEEIFSRNGLPEILVSDNASIFKSKEFQDYCKNNGIQQRLIAPGYPATNGQAERYVQILKTKLQCMKFYPGTLHSKLCKLLFRFRITPLNNGRTPSELLFGRILRSELDLIKPTSRLKNNATQPDFNKSYKLGERIQSRNYTSSIKWKYGTVVEKLGRLHYLIELDDGYVIKRHFNQLRSCQVEKAVTPFLDFSCPKRVHFSLPENSHHNGLTSQHHNQIPAHQPSTNVTSQDKKLDDPNSLLQSPEPQKNSDPKTDSRITDHPVPLRRSTRPRKPVIKLNL